MAMLIESYRGFVYPWQMDHAGHMNTESVIRTRQSWLGAAEPGGIR